MRCAKSWLFSTTARLATDPGVLNSAPYTPPVLVHQGFFFVMLAKGPRVLNSVPHSVLN